MKTIKYILLMIAIQFAINAQAQTQLSLEQAIALGLQQSKYLKLDSAKIEETTAKLIAAKNRQLPGLDVQASYLRLNNAAIDMKNKSPNGQMGDIPKINNVIYGNISVSYPLYTGGKIKNGIESARYLINAAQLNRENDKNIIALNIAQAYNNLFKADQIISVLRENLKASQKRDSTFIRLEDNGLMARNDRLKAALQTYNTELQLLDAENNYAVTMVNMDLLLGLPDSTLLQTDTTYLNHTIENQPLSFYMGHALTSRKDLDAIRNQLLSATFNTKIAKAESLPSIALTGGYLAGLIPGFVSVTNALNIGVGVQYNLASLWKKNSDLIQSKSIEKELGLNSEVLSDKIKLELNKDFLNYQLSNKKIEVYRKALEQAIENDRITTNKYKNSLVNIDDLLEAEAMLLTTKINVLNARADAVLAHKKLLQTTGILVD
ncbi:MAG TPA: TolC family protein [Saprospiraceae bacterium]|nr:TolC family protein [Saprospiraceae bacterium]